MKKTVTVSLGGMVFYLEDDAYRELASYLNRLERHFKGESDRSEILSDIELRIAEHFKDWRAHADAVITLTDVRKAIGIMGEPGDIGSEQQKEETFTASRPRRRPKRLYRNVDNSVLGGVCSGLGYYWNIDPVILRVLFVIVALWGGGGVLIYIILWIVIPAARTIAEKLEMRGEAVTAENIGRSFNENV